MNIQSLSLPEVKIITPKINNDQRGYFSEIYHFQKLASQEIEIDFVQDNQSYSLQQNVIRGLHFQSPPFAQDKLVRCISGSILDVVVDIRKSSVNFGKYLTKNITSKSFEQILVPKGFAHGVMTLEPNTTLLYKVSNYYSPDHDHGIFWNDPFLNIPWGASNNDVIVSDKDAALPKWKEFSSPF